MNNAILSSAEEEVRVLSLLTLEERIAYRKRQWKTRVDARRVQEQAEHEAELAKQAAAHLAKKQAQKQRQASNHAARVAENQRIRSDRNGNRK